MPETTPLIKAALNLRVGAGFDVYRVTASGYFASIKKEIHMKCREGIEKLGRLFLKQLKGSCRKRLELSNLR